ncbi:nucleotidyltransferase family protein [Paenibacillus alkalitolerans]|uniref:hypothetical protein n=1 Tax=Paenibacillus alkalitolerans TaxID=2799335 RepID=UPI0018F34A84|nr:hypothetical protein [Paenibacillus alkalitolerans]
MNVPQPLKQALTSLAERLSGCAEPWLVGGSSGLLLQGVALSAVPRDLDVYTDEPALSVHSLLAPLALDNPEYSRTDKYSSTLSHYLLCGVTLELVAGFQVDVAEASYRVRIREQMEAHAPEITMEGRTLRLMPLAHELLFNLLRDRSDRYVSIADRMRTALPDHLPAVKALLRGNRFGRVWRERIAALLGVSLTELNGGAE